MQSMLRIIRHIVWLQRGFVVIGLTLCCLIALPVWASVASVGQGRAAKPSVRPGKATPVVDAPLHLISRTGSAEGPIPYIVIEPAHGPADLPLIIAMHGRGSSNERFVRLLESLRLPARIIVGNGPMPWGMQGGRRWFDLAATDAHEQISQRVSDLVVLAAQLRGRFPRAPKPALLGFSQGGILALHALAEHPEHWRAVVALSADFRSDRPARFVKSAVPTLLTAGARDRIIRPANSHAAAWYLRALGHTPEVYDFPGGHAVPEGVRERVRRFLQAHR